MVTKDHTVAELGMLYEFGISPIQSWQVTRLEINGRFTSHTNSTNFRHQYTHFAVVGADSPASFHSVAMA